MKARYVVSLSLLLAGLPAALAQNVQGQVDAVGFQASNCAVLRAGQWFPVRVSLTSQGGQVFTGELRFESIDLDGDRVAFTQPNVTLTGEAGPPKRFWCYAACNATNELPSGVEVVSPEGALIAELPLPSQPLVVIPNDDFLVLDISYPAVTALNNLQVPTAAPGQPTDAIRRFYRNVIVARMPATDLPDRWWGLEAVNVLVWDQPDPAILSLAQRDALVEWVRNGGQLVLGVGSKWPALRKSELTPLLPLQGEGPTVEVQKLEVFFDRMTLPAWKTREFRNPIAVTTAQPAADACRTLGEYGPTGSLALITMRAFGSGRVVATAASLADLTNEVPVDEAKLFGALFDLNAYSKEFAAKLTEGSQYAGLVDRTWLYDGVVQPIAFGAATALRSGLAFLFVAAYIALATIVSWTWLRGRGLTHVSWTVFAGFAVAASGLSLGTVGALRSLSGGVRSVCILDMEAGSTAARGRALFGYRSATRQRADLTVPGEGNFLRPLAKDPRGASKYVTPARYAAVPAKAALDGVLMRATLKQFEGFWHGDLEGTIRADLVVDRGKGRLTAGSWIANDLSVDLAGGYLLFIDPRQDQGGVPWRAAGLTSVYALPEEEGGAADVSVVPPAINVLVVRVPKIPAGQQVSRLGQADYEQVDQNWVVWARSGNRKRSEMFQKERDLPTLWHEQQAWAAGGALARLLGDVGGPERMLLLASTRDYFLHNGGVDFKTVGRPLSTDGLPELDVTDWLMGGQREGRAVLITWADGPGPARLLRGGKPLELLDGLTVYRVRLPIYYGGNPPPSAGAASPESPRGPGS
jgi:hypothetical protein